MLQKRQEIPTDNFNNIINRNSTHSVFTDLNKDIIESITI